MAEDQPLAAHSWAEIQYYLMVTACPSCGKGPWQASPVEAGGESVVAAAVCRSCGLSRTFRFHTEGEPPPPAPAEAAQAAAVPDYSQPINPADQPSRIIDLGQWLSLFYVFLDAASKEQDRPVSRRLGYQAAQCLDEALKFYVDDEVPPPTAFFVPTSQAAFREHPERFARQRLRDLRGRLPSLHRMAQRLRQDQRQTQQVSGASQPRRPWWRFWR